MEPGVSITSLCILHRARDAQALYTMAAYNMALLQQGGSAPPPADLPAETMAPLYGSQVRLLRAAAYKRPMLASPHDASRVATKAFIAGLENTGTNFAYTTLQLLQQCTKPASIDWQVSYHPDARGWVHNKSDHHSGKPPLNGKHTYIANLPSSWNESSADCEDCAVLVMTRHPLWWAASQCLNSYNCQPKERGSCPRELKLHPVTCVWRPPTPTDTYTSLAHMWAEWNGAYMSEHVRHARIFLRYEDLLLRPRETIKQLCPLLGSSMAANASELQLPAITLSPRNQPSPTQERNVRLVNVRKALEPYTEDDLELMSNVMRAHPDTLLLGYNVPGQMGIS